MTTIFLLLGSNLGDRHANLALGRAHVEVNVGQITKTSAIYESEPWGLKDQPVFLNQAVELITSLSPQAVLKELKEMEQKAGRNEDHVRWGPRALDADILLFGQMVISETDLQVPHPRLHERRFALIPLAEIAAEQRHPLMNKAIADLLAECRDEGGVNKI
ncbi:MAG: 2-amino-4-hydroxy-6-hydroxymethyldihydropteridine diphosphokinase [Flavobacteriales bacterium]|nr:2-amino-4-hydroxy-6-hydroxymethyldihydropteridine diphosphokinase [Flavobacteriales bacterium]